MRKLVVLALVGVAVSGCEKDPKSKASQQPPAGLVLEVSFASSSLDGVRAFAGSINPLAALGLTNATLLAPTRRLTGATSYGGLDDTAPVHVLIVERPGGAAGVVIGKVGDAKQLDAGKGTATVETRDGWAVIGRDAVVHELADYALDTVAHEPAPAKPTARVYLAELARHHTADLDAVRTRMSSVSAQSSDVVQSYIDGMLSIAGDTDQARLTIDATADRAMLEIEMIARPGSRLAKFAAAQHPSDLALLGKLPDEPAMLIGAGHVELGPYHEGFATIMAALYGSATSDFGPEIAKLLENATGDFGFAMRMSAAGIGFSQLLGISDAGTADEAIARIHAGLANGKSVMIGTTEMTYKAVPGGVVHDGVVLHGFATSYGATQNARQAAMMARLAPGGTQHVVVGAFDKLMVYVGGSDAADAAGRMIDVVRGKAPGRTSTPAEAALLDLARSHQASAAMLLDVAALQAGIAGVAPEIAAPMLLSWGAASGTVQLQIVMPVASAKALAKR